MIGRSFALSENQAQWGFTALTDDFDDRRRSVAATVVSLEPVDPVTCRITRPPLRTAVDANDIVVAGRDGGNVTAINCI